MEMVLRERPPLKDGVTGETTRWDGHLVCGTGILPVIQIDRRDTCYTKLTASLGFLLENGLQQHWGN